MRGMSWSIVWGATLGLLLAVAAGAEEAVSKDSTEGEPAGRYGCGDPVKGDIENVVRPKKIRHSRILLSASELEKWGPIKMTGMIGCDGRVHDLKIDKELPKKLEAKLRKKIGKSKYKPATLGGEPFAVHYNRILKRPHKLGS